MSQKTILVIEDEEDTALFLRDRLEMTGYRVLTADDGRKGLEAAQAGLPDLVLLDVSLPGMTGYQICRQLKQDPVMRARPVIMITAKAQAGDRALGKDCGCDDYLTKPFDTDELLRKISGFLKD